jgi:hypothetical protein
VENEREREPNQEVADDAASTDTAKPADVGAADDADKEPA